MKSDKNTKTASQTDQKETFLVLTLVSGQSVQQDSYISLYRQ